MATIRLRYGELPKPVLADRDGEVDVNWVDGGTHSLTADATHPITGTKSFLLTATDVGDFTTNYISLASGNNSTFVVGKQYVVTIRTWATGGTETFKLKTGGVESGTFSCAASTEEYHHFTFTAVTATTAFQMIGTKGGGCEIYFELLPFAQYAEFTVLAERGITEPDSVEFFPPLQHEYRDGGLGDDIRSYRRKAWVDIGVVHEAADRRRILAWLIDNDRQIDYGTEVALSFALADIGGYENEWKYNVSLMRYYTFSLRESAVRTGDFPV